MWTFLLSFLISFAIATLGTPIARHLALRWGAIDRPGARRVQAGEIPRLGGLAIVAAFYAPLTGLLFIHGDVGAIFKADIDKVVGIYAGGIVVAALGVYDDIRGVGALGKFTVQFGIGALLYALGFRMTVLSTPFGGTLDLGWLGLPLTLLWVAGVINAINLIDGLDGLAAGVALIAVTTIFAMSLHNGNSLMALFAASLGGALVGFLIFNFNPATIFMGDSGSMFIGFVLAAASIQTASKSSTAVAVLAPMVALGLPIVDTLLAMVRRLSKREPMFRADREHIHHQLMAVGYTQRKSVIILYTICIGLATIALVLQAANAVEAAILLGGLGIASIVGVRVLGVIVKRRRPTPREGEET